MRISFPAATWAWLALVGVASLLTWVTFRIPTYNSEFPAFGGFPNEVVGGAVISANAWKSSLQLVGMQVPNWLPITAAFGAATAFCALDNGADLSPKLPRLLIIYAFIHVAFFGFIIWSEGRSSIGIGPLVMLFALGGLWKTIVIAPARNNVKTPIIQN